MADSNPTDTLLDYANEIVNTPAKARARDRNFERLADGVRGCEVCGRALKADNTSHYQGLPLGPTCAKKLAVMGLDVTF